MAEDKVQETAEKVAKAEILKLVVEALERRAAEADAEVPLEARVLKANDELPGGVVVDMILGQSETISVYTTKDRQLRWIYHANGGDMPPPLLKIISRFDTLMAEISTGVPEKFRRKALVQLGKALFSAVDGGDVEGMEIHFGPVANFIKSKALPPARLHYIAGSSLATLLLVSVFSAVAQFTVPNDMPQYQLVVGGIGGSLGAFISVLQRSTTIEVDYNWDTGYILVQGAARILLGMLFGMFAVIACHADIVLGFVKSSLPSLLILASVAGVSERFVPEIIKRLEAQGDSQKKGT